MGFSGGLQVGPGGRSGLRAVAFAVTCTWLFALMFLCREPALADFIRGDANRDGVVNVTDAVTTLDGLISRGTQLHCQDAADADDNGRLNIADAIRILLFLFHGGEPLSNPGNLIGPDPTCDLLGCEDAPDPTPAIVFSEIHYNSPEPVTKSEFVELHNRTGWEIDASGYRLVGGVDYTLPEGSLIPANGFLVVAEFPGAGVANALGPYGGQLSNSGERIELVDTDGCLLEELRYADRLPWVEGADGYGPTMERVSYTTPADDFHSWRASFSQTGTAGAQNSSAGVPTHPMIRAITIKPTHPTSSDPVAVELSLDLASAAIEKVEMNYRRLVSPARNLPGGFVAMALQSESGGRSRFAGTIPPQVSQSLVRFNVNVELKSGESVLLPHEGEVQPFQSYFVYDGELQHLLPIVWLIPLSRSDLYSRGAPRSGAIFLEPGSTIVQVFDGAQNRRSPAGCKLKFLKGQEYRGDRTLNIQLEVGGDTGGAQYGPHQEHLGYQVFDRLGVFTPRAEWFRVITYRNPETGHRHSQRLIIQQVNERFLGMRGFTVAGDLYKLDAGWEKKTNPRTGSATLNELGAQQATENISVRRSWMLENVEVENVRNYSIASILISNWDGFHKNLYIYHPLGRGDRWWLFPWDLDQVFEPTHVQLRVHYPLDGLGGTAAREPGFMSSPHHGVPDFDAAYRAGLIAATQPGGVFDVDFWTARTEELEAFLLQDVELMQEVNGPAVSRRLQIESSYNRIRNFLTARTEFLKAALE